MTTKEDSMTKSQLLDRSRELGKEMITLLNEYRNSSGENATHDEAYFEDYFAGLIAFLCTGDGEIKLEYSKAKHPDEESFIDGEIVVNSEVRYLFSDVHIHDFKSVEETTCHKEGRLDKHYKIKMDPITFLYWLMGTDFAGKKVFDGAGVHEATL